MNLYQQICDEYGKPKPILFNTEMVRAILDNKKTQTRRPIKSIGNNLHNGRLLCDWPLSEKPNIENNILKWELQVLVDSSEMFEYKLPYQPGDILYVRETWKTISTEPYEHKILINYFADDYKQYVKFLPVQRYFQFEKYLKKNGNHANIFMPKEAARIFLKVTDVRVERVQDITNSNTIKEGIEETEIYNDMLDNCTAIGAGTGDLPIQAFAELWDGLYQKKGYGWNNNPWIWVIEFGKFAIAGDTK